MNSFWIAFSLYVATLLVLAYFSFKHGTDVVVGFKGADGRWQPAEVIILVWLILFTAMTLGDLFLNLTASSALWDAMVYVFGLTVFGKAGLEYVRKPNNKNEKAAPKPDQEEFGD